MLNVAYSPLIHLPANQQELQESPCCLALKEEGRIFIRLHTFKMLLAFAGFLQYYRAQFKNVLEHCCIFLLSCVYLAFWPIKNYWLQFQRVSTQLPEVILPMYVSAKPQICNNLIVLYFTTFLLVQFYVVKTLYQGQERSCLGLKYLVLWQPTRLEMSQCPEISSCFATSFAGQCPDMSLIISNSFWLTKVGTHL